MFRLTLALLIPYALLAQTATLTGRVTDSTGLAIERATVRLVAQAGTDERRTQTDLKGTYKFDRIAPGGFIIEVEKPEFRHETRVVDLNATSKQDFTLTVAGVNQIVSVTAAGAAQIDQEISKSIDVVDHDDIQNRNATSLADVVRLSPGIQILSDGGYGQLVTFRMRGLDTAASSILIDGLRFRDTTTLQADASSFLSSLNFIAADRVEVLRGSGSSLYGSNAAGGAVNIVTNQGGGPTHGEVQLEGGNLGLIRGRASISGGLLDDRFKFSAGLLHLNETNGTNGDDAARSSGGQAFARFDFSPRLSLSARVLASDDFALLNVSPSTDTLPAANFPVTGIIRAVPNVTFVPNQVDGDSRRASRFASTAVIFRDAVSANFNWQATYQHTYTDRIYDDGPAGPGYYQPTADDHSQYTGGIDTVDVHATAQLNRAIAITGGYEVEREAYADLQNNNLPGTSLLLEKTHIAQNSQAGYFASQIALLDRRLQISFSGRLQTFQLEKPDFQFRGTGDPYSSVPLQSPPKALTGDASIAYFLPRTSTKLHAHFGNAYRAPSLYERFGAGFYTDPSNGAVIFTPYGDPRLAPDRYNSVDAGIDQYLFQEKVKLSATYFYTRIVQQTIFDFSGAISPATDPYGRAYGYANGAGGISRGVELQFEARPTRSLTIKSAYTYVNSETDRDASVPGFYRALGIPAHTFSALATKSWKRFDATLDVFRSGSYYTPFYVGYSTRAFQFPGFTTTGLTANYRLWQGEKRSVRAYTRINNLFGQTYYQNGWLAAKATFVTGLGFAF